MLHLIFLFFVGMVLVFLLFGVVIFLSFLGEEGEKVFPLESGFVSVGGGYSYFSLQFFLLLVIFIVFDLEIILMLGLLFLSMKSSLVCLLFFLFVFITLWLEWVWGKLIWFS